MTTSAEWLAGARPRTLPAAISPVMVGTSVAHFESSALPARALLALLVSLSLQVGVNYANDYSDGIRGTDTDRVGPARLVGQGLASPAAVKRAALGSFGVASLAGLSLVITSGMWWLLLVGIAAITAAWTYTGGPRPYGYAGLGEVFVFTFFGLVAVGGTALVQVGSLSALAVACGVGVGAIACAILVVNNLRDIAGDAAVQKRTLAVRVGDRRTRSIYLGLIALAFTIPAVLALLGLHHPTEWPRGSLAALVAVAAAIGPVNAVRANALGADLVPVLSGTGKLLLVYGASLAGGIALSA